MTHLGGWYAGGDKNTYMPDAWAELVKTKGIRSVVDIGCGAGWNLAWFVKNVPVAIGVEGDREAVKIARSIVGDVVLIHDYLNGSALNSRYDLGICSEFAEHVHAVHEDNWLSDLALCKYVLFTHGLPGQGGHHHVNEQPEYYWLNRFAEYGFSPDWDFTNKHRDPSARWGKNTLILFERSKNATLD
jgi:SAM-dependent methyltransferase